MRKTQLCHCGAPRQTKDLERSPLKCKILGKVFFQKNSNFIIYWSKFMEQVHCLKWFLVQLKPNSAQIAKRNLERQGFRVFNPTRLITKRASSKFVDKHEQLFPGYMFVSFDPEDGRWQAINSTFGVARLVQFGSMPKHLPIPKPWRKWGKRSEGPPPSVPAVFCRLAKDAKLCLTFGHLPPILSRYGVGLIERLRARL